MNDNRIEEYYKGFSIIADFFKGEFQARAYCKFTDKIKVIKCKSINEAVAKSKKSIDACLKNNLMEIQRKITEHHEVVMIKIGKDYSGVRTISSSSRVNHCYNCRRVVDNAIDLECVTCNWIICGNCCSCGCGYSRF